MYQKELVRQAWEAAGLYRSRDQKLQEFLSYFDAASGDCWPEIVAQVRERYPEYLERLVAPLWNAGDPLVRLNLIRFADTDRPEEHSVLAKLVRRVEPAAAVLELHAVMEKGDQQLLDLVARKRNLPPETQQLLT